MNITKKQVEWQVRYNLKVDRMKRKNLGLSPMLSLIHI